MNINKGMIIKGFLALVLTPAVLYTWQSIWMNYAVASPLDKALNGIDGVKKVTLHKSKKLNKPVEVNIALESDVNLEKVYSEINDKIADTLKNKPYVLEIEDNRTQELEQLYQEINLYVQKAIVDGNFPVLAQNAEEKAESVEAHSKVYVDDKNVYLQLSKKGNFLYAVISRPSQNLGGDM